MLYKFGYGTQILNKLTSSSFVCETKLLPTLSLVILFKLAYTFECAVQPINIYHNMTTIYKRVHEYVSI